MQHRALQHSTHVGCTHNTTTCIAHIPSAVPAPRGGTTWKAWLETVLNTLLGLVNYIDLSKVRLDFTIGFRSWFCVFLALAPE